MDKNDPFIKVFQEATAKLHKQNEQARSSMEATLTALRDQTGLVQAATGPDPFQELPKTAQPKFSTLNPVTTDWVKIVVQAASIDAAFLQEVEEKATKIAQTFLQQSTPGETAEPGAVSSGPNSG